MTVRRGLTATVALVLLAAGLPVLASSATSAAAPTPRTDNPVVCDRVTSRALDVAAAASLNVRMGPKGPVPLGAGRARSLAKELDTPFDGSVLCSATGSTALEDALAAISQLISDGQLDEALAQLHDLLSQYSISSISGLRAAAVRQPRDLPAEPCKGLTSQRDYEPPTEVTDALRASRYLQEQAQMVSDPSVSDQMEQLAEQAISQAQDIIQQDVLNGASNAVTSGDWLQALAALQAMGLDESPAAEFATSKARSAAQTAVRIQAKSKCPSSREVNCLGRAIAAYDMLGGSEAAVSGMINSFAKAARDSLDPEKDKDCKGELYEFRYIWTDSTSSTSGDTGTVRFKIIKEKVVFQNFAALSLSDGAGVDCAEILLSGSLGRIITSGHIQGGVFGLDATLSSHSSRPSTDSINLVLNFRDAMFMEKWNGFPWPPCALTPQSDSRKTAANEHVIDLLEGISLPRRENAMSTTGPVRWFLSYKGEQ